MTLVVGDNLDLTTTLDTDTRVCCAQIYQELLVFVTWDIPHEMRHTDTNDGSVLWVSLLSLHRRGGEGKHGKESTEKERKRRHNAP